MTLSSLPRSSAPRKNSSNTTGNGGGIGGDGCALIALWAVGILVLALVAGYWAISAACTSRASSIERHQARLDPNATQAGKTAPKKSASRHENDIPVDVHVGIYIDRIVEISVKDTGWTVDFYIWFNWTGEGIQPGENFQVMEGVPLLDFFAS